MNMLNYDGVMVFIGLNTEEVSAFTLVFQRQILAGSFIAGIAETQEMFDYCAEHKIACDVEVISTKDINTAFARIENKDVK
jgi:alcohol dehydrogenase (NADP+)